MKRFLSILLSVSAAILLLLGVETPASAQYDKDVFSFRGRNALSEGRHSEAIANFNILAQLDSTDYWTFFYRGIAKYNLGDVRGAMKDFNTTVRLNPVFTSGYHYRAITENRFGNYEGLLPDKDGRKYFECDIDYDGGHRGARRIIYSNDGLIYYTEDHYESFTQLY